MLENEEWSTVWQYGAYQRFLATHWANASQFYAVRHDSWPDYLAVTSGLENNYFKILSTTTLPDLVEHAGLSWAGFMENMPTTCDPTTRWSLQYDAVHNPFIWYKDVIANPTRCAAHDVPIDFPAWSHLIQTNGLPNYVFLTPNVFHDGHNYDPTCVPPQKTQQAAEVMCADSFLRQWLPPLINDSAVFAQTAIVVTYDEGESYQGVSGGHGGGHVYTVVVSPIDKRGFNSGAQYNDFDILTTTEWLLGLPERTGNNDNWATWPPMCDLFSVSCPT